MTRMRTRNARWHPFEGGGSGDFDIQEIAERLGINKVRAELLAFMLEKFQLTFWFHDDEGADEDESGKNPSLEVSAFWFDRHIGDADLLPLLEDILKDDDNQIGWEEEITVLEKLKAEIELAIELRRIKLSEGVKDNP